MATNVAVYTRASWQHAISTLRVTGPLGEAGMTLRLGSDGRRVDPQAASEADVVLVQRDFPRLTAYEAVRTNARASRRPIVLDLDDLLLELPADHPDRLNHYYSGALFPLLEAILTADAVTASTEALCAYLRPLNASTYLLPNYLNDRHWRLRPPRASLYLSDQIHR